MVGVAQVVEHWVVAPVVVGSSPITHPTSLNGKGGKTPPLFLGVLFAAWDFRALDDLVFSGSYFSFLASRSPQPTA